MGGRGTGKSTLLYFLKSSIFTNAEADRTINSIIQNNLGTGEVYLEIEGEDGIIYTITKTFNEAPQPYTGPNSEYVPIEKIFNEIECDFYQTGKIEEIGRSEKERLDLIDKKIKNEIKGFQSEIAQLQIELDANAQDISSFNQRLFQVDQLIAQYEGIEEDFEKHKNLQPVGLKEEEKTEFEQADLNEKIRKDEKRFFLKTIDLLNDFRSHLQHKQSEVKDSLARNLEGSAKFLNKVILDPAVGMTDESIKKISLLIEDALKILQNNIDGLSAEFTKLNSTHELQQADFIKLKQKFDINREYINTYHNLSKRLNDKQILSKDKEELYEKKNKLKASRELQVQKLNELKQSIFKIRLQTIKELNESFEGAIVINLTYAGITNEFEQLLRDGLKGSGMKYNELIPRIVENFSTDEFAKIIHGKNTEKLKTISGIDEGRSLALIDALYETQTIYDIEKMYCKDLPEFKLRIHEGGLIEENYRRTEELSMGQRCTTVLPIIFAVSKNPLIIDQPEDNLDNKFITDKIHEIIKKQKEDRQLILITHNPNIPVLSDSDQNVFLKYDRKSSIETDGNVNEVKGKIVELLEGGAGAFKKRMEIYGY